MQVEGHPIAVRLGTNEDLDAIAQLGAYVQSLHFCEHPELFLAPDIDAIFGFFEQQLARDEARVLVAVDGSNAVIGYALAVIGTKVANPFKPAVDFVELDQIAVDPSKQGKGAGTALMGAVLDLVTECGADEAHLSVWNFNERAISLYEQFGFEALQMRVLRLTDTQSESRK